MIAVVDNNLPLSLARRLAELQKAVEVRHLVDLGLQHQSDEKLRRHWQNDEVIWVPRDEDFWLGSPKGWAVVWVNCHNPRLVFLRDRVAPAIASRIPDLTPGCRLLVTEEIVSLM